MYGLYKMKDKLKMHTYEVVNIGQNNKLVKNSKLVVIIVK